MSPETPDQANSTSGFVRGDVSDLPPDQQQAVWQQRLADAQTAYQNTKPGDSTLPQLAQQVAYAQAQLNAVNTDAAKNATATNTANRNATAATHYGNVDSTAAARAGTAAAAQGETARHNAATEAQTATNDTTANGLKAQALQLQQQSAAETAAYHQALINAKGDATQIAAVKEQFAEQQALFQDKLNNFKDVVTSLGSMDASGLQSQTQQASDRNNAAMSYAPNAMKAVSDAAGNYGAAGPAGAAAYASALGSAMQAGPALSHQMGGDEVPVQQLTDQHKQMIYSLVTQAGMGFNDAVNLVGQSAGQGVPGAPNPAPNAPAATPPPSGWTAPGAPAGYPAGNAGAGGAMNANGGFSPGQ